MSALLKEVLALTIKNEAALWRTVEQKVLTGLPSLATSELVQITKHFGNSQQGSNALWQQLDAAAVKAFPTLSADQTLSLISGFGEVCNTYELSQQLDSLLTVSWDQLGKLSLQKKKEADPYFVANILKELSAGAPVWLRAQQKQDFSRDLNKLEIPPNAEDVTYSVRTVNGSPLRPVEEREAYIE